MAVDSVSEQEKGRQEEGRDGQDEREDEARQDGREPFLLLSPTQHAPANGLAMNGSSHQRGHGHTHARSRSLAAPSSAPVMARAHSSPGLDSRGRIVFPRSSPGKASSPVVVGYGAPPLGPQELPLRRPSPLRTSFEGHHHHHQQQQQQQHGGGHGITAISEPISEQPELQASPVSYTSHPGSGGSTIAGRTGSGRSVSPSWSPAVHNTLPRVSRRRPSSPLLPNYTSNGHAGVLASTSSASSAASSPSSRPSPLILPKFNEPYPVYSFSLASSMPSTPTSIRSRSPSISSLETIPDIPDAEAAAIEADQIARLKAAADRADAAEAGGFLASSADLKRRSALDMSPSLGSRFGSGWADKRKRWSVCGAEGRQDLDLETIWED
ncbi:hypothetical protein MferCBS31731_007019 [Microsporum ferrugineum]